MGFSHQTKSIDRYKARLVAKGFHQQPSVDFLESRQINFKKLHEIYRELQGVNLCDQANPYKFT